MQDRINHFKPLISSLFEIISCFADEVDVRDVRSESIVLESRARRSSEMISRASPSSDNRVSKAISNYVIVFSILCLNKEGALTDVFSSSKSCTVRRNSVTDCVLSSATNLASSSSSIIFFCANWAVSSWDRNKATVSLSAELLRSPLDVDFWLSKSYGGMWWMADTKSALMTYRNLCSENFNFRPGIL